MSTHEELDAQYALAVNIDGARDDRLRRRALSASEIELGRARIREWPLEERKFVTRLTEHEARLIVELAALLDARPEP